VIRQIAAMVPISNWSDASPVGAVSAVAGRSPSVGNRNNFRLYSFGSKSLKSEFSHAPTARTTNEHDYACVQIRH
jgi:hypothetical protein